jgi:hypothetical protein
MVQQQKLDAQRDGTHSLLFIKSPDVNWMTLQDTPSAIPQHACSSVLLPREQIPRQVHKATNRDCWEIL